MSRATQKTLDLEHKNLNTKPSERIRPSVFMLVILKMTFLVAMVTDRPTDGVSGH